MNTDTTQNIKSLADLRIIKDRLRNDIVKDEEHIGILWDELFHKPCSDEASSPTKRFSNMMGIGTGIIDGILLGWKLYRKFKGTTDLFRKRRR